MAEFVQRTDGPDRSRGGPKCPDHHDGVRTGLVDWCCCCNPCLYERPPQELNNTHCCRCVPQALCIMFTPDPDGDACCRILVQTVFANHSLEGYTYYSGGFTGALFDIRVGREPDSGLPCSWHFLCEELGLDEYVSIDHLDSTCLDVPDISVTDFVNASGCVGTLTITAYNADKVPFANRNLIETEDAVIVDSPCGCEVAARTLCVYGRRHADGDVEGVEFVWDEDLQRWVYLPPCGDPTTDREVIYLRGDSEGGCYLELDFEQSGSETNDWADPPNTIGEDEHEVRDGMIAIDRCGCGLRVYSETTGNRWVRIHAGPCGRWQYHCGTCRCAPTTICVVGEIDGVMVDVRMVWNGDDLVWEYDGSGDFPTAFTIGLGGGTCEGDPPGRESDDCYAIVENVFSRPFQQSTPIECGKFLTFEIETAHDPDNPTAFNWLWGQSGVCGCEHHVCALCAEERCGGAPDVLYVELQGRSLVDPADPTIPEDVFCDLTVPVSYYERWTEGVMPSLDCGYIGYAMVACGANTYRLRVELAVFASSIRLTRENMETGEITTHAANNTPIAPSSCDPYWYDRDWQANTCSDTPPLQCFWGCEPTIKQYKLSILE